MSNAENNKRIAKNTALLYVRMLFLMAVSLYTSREVLRILGVEDFGIYNVVGGLVLMFGFLNSAMTAAVQRYISFELGRGISERLHTIFCMAVMIHLVLALVSLLLAGVAGGYILYAYLNIPPERFHAACVVFLCSLLSFGVTIVQVPYMASIIAHEKMGVYAAGTIMDSCAKLGGIIALGFFPGDKLIWYGVVLLSISVAVALFYRIYCITHFEECRFRRKWDKSLFKEMFAYSGWSLFGGVASVIPPQGVNMLLNVFFGPAVNAARGIAYQVNAAVSSLYSSFTQAVNPQIVKQYSGGNLEYMHQLIFRSCRFTYLLVWLLACPILLETEQILRLWLHTVPAHAVVFCRLILVSTLIDSLATPLIPAVQATGRIRNYQVLVSCLLLLNLPFSYVALKLTGVPEASFCVGILVSVLTASARLLMCRRLVSLSLRTFGRSVLLRVVPVSLLTSVSFVIPTMMEENYARLLFSLAAGVLLTIASTWFIGITKGERAFIGQRIRNIKSRISGRR